MATVTRRAKASANGRAKKATPTNRIAELNSIVPQVYDYKRFSDLKQDKGDSERRQQATSDAARKYAKKIGLPFNESLQMFDKGKSAFRGTHLKRGFLGKFLELIKQGRIAPGSVLVIEEIDRFSRQEPIDHLELFIDFVKHGVNIYTPGDDTLYSRESVNSGLIWKLIAKIQNAHDESLKKSKRLEAVWEQKRKLARERGIYLNKDGTPSKKHPDWLTIKDNKYAVIPEAAKSILMAYRLREKGLRATAIKKHLVANAPWKRKWIRAYVQYLLTCREVIGEVQQYTIIDGDRGAKEKVGEPIKIYPNLFGKCPGLYESVQEKAKASKPVGGGRNGKARNLLQKLVKCGYCGEAMHFADQGDGRRALVCCNGCESSRMKYDEVESLVLSNCPRLRPDQVLPNKTEEAKRCKSLRLRVERTTAELAEKNRAIANLNDSLENEDDPEQRADLSRRVKERRAEVVALKEQLDQGKQKLEQAEHGLKRFKNWQADFATLSQQLHKQTEDNPPQFVNIGLRHRMNSHLRDLIDRIEVFAIGHKAEYNLETDDGDSFCEYMEGLFGDTIPGFPRKQDREFIRYVIARRMTKEGRFVRVRFKNGHHIDLVPHGSLASGIGLIAGQGPLPSITIITPNIEQLDREFSHKPRKPR